MSLGTCLNGSLVIARCKPERYYNIIMIIIKLETRLRATVGPRARRKICRPRRPDAGWALRLRLVSLRVVRGHVPCDERLLGHGLCDRAAGRRSTPCATPSAAVRVLPHRVRSGLLPHEDHASNLVGPVRDEKGLLGRSRPLGSFDENGRRVRRARSRKTSEPRGRVGHSRRARRHRQGRSRRARMGGSNCSESRWAKPSLITVCRAGRWFAQARRLGPDEEVRKQWISHEMNDVALDVSQALARKSV